MVLMKVEKEEGMIVHDAYTMDRNQSCLEKKSPDLFGGLFEDENTEKKQQEEQQEEQKRE